MDRYKKRGIPDAAVVEAVELTQANVKEVAALVSGHEVTEIDALDSSKKYVGLNFEGFDGMTRASEGDYIIRDAVGDFHVRWATVFHNKFEKVDT